MWLKLKTIHKTNIFVFIGFQNDTATACEFCSTNGTNSCCQSISGGCDSHHLSGGAIAGIVLGCVVAAVMAAVLIYFCFCRRPKRFQKESKFSPYVPQQFQNRHQRSFNVLRSGSKQSLVASSPYEPGTISTASAIPETPTTPPPLPTTFTHEIEEFYVAVHPYPPQIVDELELHVGDVVCLAMIFDDGWGLGFNVNTGLKGAFPLVCVTPASREVLEQVLMGEDTYPSQKTITLDDDDDNYSDRAAFGSYMPAPTNANIFNQPPNEKRFSQDKLEINMERIRETLRRSISLSQSSRPVSSQSFGSLSHSNTIPKRTASMRSAQTAPGSAPTSPTTPTSPNSPLFGMTPLSSALLRSRNYQQDDDTYEMLNQHRQRNGSIGSSSWMQSN